MGIESKPVQPPETVCQGCGRRAAETICSLCKRPRYPSTQAEVEEQKVNYYGNVMCKRDRGDDTL